MRRFFLLILLVPSLATAQPFQLKWLNIGDFQNVYSYIGAVPEGPMGNRGMVWPGFLPHSGHTRAEGLWIGAKNWTDTEGIEHPYSVVRVGPRNYHVWHGQEGYKNAVIPLEHRLVSKWPATEVSVDGLRKQDPENLVLPDAIDPLLPADRMVHTRLRTQQGIELDIKAFAFSNAHHDDYHILVRTLTNTGNVDDDDEIELADQTLNDVMLFNVWRWTGRSQAAWGGSVAQVWGKFSMLDVVGDGYEEYPVDFTATYAWAGLDTSFDAWDPLGSPLLDPNEWSQKEDSTGRLAGMSMSGIAILHADNGPADPSFDPAIQPHTIGFFDMDEVLTADGQTDRDYYELGILTRENPALVPGGASRMNPHYADRIVPAGNFWNSDRDASSGKSGGHGNTVAYGPYTLAFGEQITVVEVLAADGLSYEAADAIGRAFKTNGLNPDAPIAFDANGDGIIDQSPFDYSIVNNGTEEQTKNQWFLSSRDSLFNSFEKARAVWEASAGMTRYPVLEPPRPPALFEITSTESAIHLSWELHPNAVSPQSWKLYRLKETAGEIQIAHLREPYEEIAILDPSVFSYTDTNVARGEDYYYYLIAEGASESDDPSGISGTPGSVPLSSSRYFTQTNVGARLREPMSSPGLIVRLQAKEGEARSEFGSNVILSGQRALVGAHVEGGPVGPTGAAYIFEQMEDLSWAQTARLAPDPLHPLGVFGLASAFDGTRAFIGACRGRMAYVFEYSIDQGWRQVQAFTNPVETYSDGYACSVGLSGDTVFIGATGVDSELALNVGAVYVFERQPEGSWEEMELLLPEFAPANANFGEAIAVDDGRLLIGAPGTTSNNGKAYLFEQHVDGRWIEWAEFEDPQAFPGGRFGSAVSIAGDLTAIASKYEASVAVGGGAVTIFERRADGNWQVQQKIHAPESTIELHFGTSLAIEEGRLLVGTEKDKAFLYERDPTGAWVLTTSLTDYGFDERFETFGRAVDLQEGIALIGAVGMDVSLGSAHLIDTRVFVIDAESLEGNEDVDLLPQTALMANYPNPFYTTTAIEFTLSEPQEVRLSIYDVLGRQIQVLVDDVLPSGTHQRSFHAGNLASGMYYYRMETPTKTLTQSMLLVK